MNSKVYIGFVVAVMFSLLLFGCFNDPILSVPESSVSDIENNETLPDVEKKLYTNLPNDFKQNNFIWFYKPPVYDSQIDYLIENFSFFILTKNDEWLRDQIFAEIEDVEIPQYLLFNVIYNNEECLNSPWQNQVAFRIDDFCWIQREHPDWFLRNDAGKIITEDINLFIDPQADGWLEFYVERVNESQTDFGWDGIFFDNLDASLNRFTSRGIELATYTTDDAYVAANVSFLKEFHEIYALPNEKNLYANITFLPTDSDAVEAYLLYLDGFMLEDWATDWHDGYQDVDQWTAKLAIVRDAVDNDKKVFLVSQGNEVDYEHQLFAYASYLLVANENVFYRYTDAEAYNQIWFFDIYDTDLGIPLTNYYTSEGVYYRDFSNGVVMVDPYESIAEIHLNEK